MRVSGLHVAVDGSGVDNLYQPPFSVIGVGHGFAGLLSARSYAQAASQNKSPEPNRHAIFPSLIFRNSYFFWRLG